MITYKNDLEKKVQCTEEEFHKEVVDMIEFNVNEKGYPIDNITPDLIAEDITGIFENHQMPEEGMNIIVEEIQRAMKEISDLKRDFIKVKKKIITFYNTLMKRKRWNKSKYLIMQKKFSFILKRALIILI